MSNVKDIASGTIITLLIGGGVYSVSQTDIIDNFASETGLSQEQAEQYIDAIPEDELASWKEVGSGLLNEGHLFLELANEIDCVNYDYGWESPSLSCPEGKEQMNKLSRDTTSLGILFTKLDEDSATTSDIQETIRHIDQLVSDYQFEIFKAVVDMTIIDENTKTLLYNKAVLRAALESE